MEARIASLLDFARDKFDEITNRYQLIKFLKENHFEDEYGKIYYANLLGHDRNIREFLDRLGFLRRMPIEEVRQVPSETRKFLRDEILQDFANIEPQEQTQKSHEERQTLRDFGNIEINEPTQKSHEERKALYEDRKLKENIDKPFKPLFEYVENHNTNNPEYVDLEFIETVKEEKLKEATDHFTKRLKELFSKMKGEVYLFQFTILNDKGDKIQRSFILSQQNTKELFKQLEEHGLSVLDKADNEGVNKIIYSDPTDEMSRIPSFGIMSSFRVLRYSDRYGHDPSQKQEKQEGERKKNERQSGGFFRWFAIDILPKSLLNQLKRYQILTRKDFEGKGNNVLKDSCAVYALKQAGVSEDAIKNMEVSRLTEDRILTVKDFATICEEYDIYAQFRNCEEGYENTHHKNEVKKVVKPSVDSTCIPICYYKGHFFLDEETPFTKSNIDFLEFDKDFEAHVGKVFKGGRWRKQSDIGNLRSWQLVKMLFERHMFEEMTYEDYLNIPQITLNKELADVELKWNPKMCLKPASELYKERNDKKSWNVYYADFETDTKKGKNEPHKPYLVCYSDMNGEDEGYFEGYDCGEKLLKYLPNNSIIIYHNLKYDINFIGRYFGLVKTAIERGKTKMMWEGYYRGKCFRLKDSASLIPKRLAEFPKMFQLKTGAKEKMPYNYVSYKVYMENKGKIEGCGEKEDKPWNEEDYKEFRESLKVADAELENDSWDVKKYVRYYCEQDVRILREGFNKFRDMIKDDFGFDVLDIHSASSLAYKVIMENVLLKDDRIYATSGILDQFIRQAIVGGRVMTRDNKAWHTKIDLVDFDAVSLYPSAMSTMKIPLGEPQEFEKVIPEEADYYVVEIILKKVNKYRHFPLIRVDEENNAWADDESCLNRRYVIDKQTLEDWVEFQGIEYEVVRGIYWNQGTSSALAEFIVKIFERRKQLKSEGNPLQEVYKLILNSIYGKMIQKAYPTKKAYINRDKVNDFIYRNYQFILPNDYQISDSDIHVFETRKGIRDIFTFTLLGVMCLSHSKHLMNRVMCLAEDLNIPLFYQDTDSMHLAKDRLPELAKAFKAKYGSELIGKNLCQFHSDFDSEKLSKTGKEIYAVESYFLAKKVYVDVLTCEDTEETDLHIRMKGVSKEAILNVSSDVLSIYKQLYEKPETKISFDLAKGKPCFDIDKTLRVFSRKEFTREISIPREVQRLEYIRR